jgi:hypothetical protein
MRNVLRTALMSRFDLRTPVPLVEDRTADLAIAPTVIGAARTSRASGREAAFVDAPAELGIS